MPRKRNVIKLNAIPAGPLWREGPAAKLTGGEIRRMTHFLEIYANNNILSLRQAAPCRLPHQRETLEILNLTTLVSDINRFSCQTRKVSVDNHPAIPYNTSCN